MESITNLHLLTICVREAGISTLACALPALRLLHYLSINSLDLDKDKVVIISSSLKAWPLPFLVDINCFHMCRICCEVLALPPSRLEAAGWTNTEVLEHCCVFNTRCWPF